MKVYILNRLNIDHFILHVNVICSFTTKITKHLLHLFAKVNMLKLGKAKYFEIFIYILYISIQMVYNDFKGIKAKS